jgi:cytochrome P450/NADPH-cytochrome P450 reductase
MDATMGTLPKGHPVIVITASYEGQPCDNATRFIARLESAKDDKAFAGVNFAVFGCGHKDWVNTFHRIPKLVDGKLGELGGSRIVPMGGTDVSKGTIFDDFDLWMETDLWPALPPSGALAEPATTPSTVTLELSPQSREAHLQQNLQWADVLEVKQLTGPGQPEKRHIEIELPSGMTFQAGDYLAVLPLNPEDTVKRAIKRFNLPWDAVCTITDPGPSILPVDCPLPLFDLLRGYVELSQPATVKDITILASHASNGSEAEKLKGLTDPEKHAASIHSNRVSILDLLQKYPSIDLPFNQFLALLPPLKPRQYSISSSPLASPGSCTITYSVIDTASLSDPSIAFQGVTGSYLKSLKAGDKVLVGVRSTNKTFRLPSSPETTPIVMFAAGSGVAPFRGFIQERAVMMCEGGRKLAHAVLFLGCRHPESDALYAAEFKEWEKLGAVEVRYAFSQSPESSEGCKYVQDRMVRDKGSVVEMWDAGAKVYACGSSQVAQEIGRAAKGIVKERVRVEGRELSEEELEGWMRKMTGERIVSDIFA